MSFEELYKKLNPEQKKAVDTVEGPVMVIAGPGTGKTHILTLRIANILKETQAKPTEILALTFTHSAADTMRKRLADIIGEETSRDVFITTFHSFCEQILDRYSEYFPLFASRRPMSDVEQTLLFREVFENSESSELRPPKAPYTYLSDLKNIYETLTREGMTLEEYRLWGEQKKETITNDPELQYVRGEKKGQLKKVGQQKLKKYEKVAEAADMLEVYQQLKDERGVYDFGDMLRVAIDGIGEHSELRAVLQEQYQYILADEHQDANALQHKLLKLLAYDEHPNIFVVGDEKQAIYRFQGADVGEFRSFTELFPRALVITLKDSFRSLQHVLDTAHTVVEHTGTHERLEAKRKGDSLGASIVVAHDSLDERERVATYIAEYITQGVPPHEIAVIARKNETANAFAHHLEAQGIPTLRAGDVSLTARPIVRYVLALMDYAADPMNVHALRFQVLAPWWKESILDRTTFLRTSSNRDTAVRLSEQLPDMSTALAEIVQKVPRLTPVEAFSFLLERSGARDFLLSHSEHFDDIPLIRTLMQQLEEVGDVNATFAETVSMLRKAHEHNLNVVKRSITEQEGMVTVITAHKAKGMEFQYVFVPDLVERSWERSGKGELIPSPFTTKEALDDARRLFYVALTRAKDHAYISYALFDKEGRERKPSVLIPALPEKHAEKKDTDIPILHTTVPPTKLVRDLTRQYLAHEGLAPTALSEYLKSPPTFFALRVLKLREPDTGPALLGNAVHRGIAHILNGKSREESHKIIENTFFRSTLGRGKVYDDLLARAKESLDVFVSDPVVASTLLGGALFTEQKYTKKYAAGNENILLQGRIDAAFTVDGKTVIVDFKTGSVSVKDEAIRRQLAFYGELLAGSPHETDRYMLVEVRPEGIKMHTVDVSSEEKTKMLTELDNAVRELLTGSWRKGEPSSYDALLNLS